MDAVFMNTYHRLPVTFVSGEGSWLKDRSGKKYLDFTAGIAVNCLGHAHPILVKAIGEQAAKFNHVCNYYQSDVAEAFAQKLVAACATVGMRKVFLGNSGAEANEGACKIARKYSLKKYGPGRHTIVSLKGSFHGRTITTLSATGQARFHQDFGPFTEGFRFIPPGDLDALDRALDPASVAGLLLEAIQGESGIFPLDSTYVAAAAQLCKDRDILLIFDEIQCGVGRTGTFLACAAYGVNADILTLAKGLCGGVPVGAVLAGDKAADVLGIGDHGSTFGGNPLAAAAGLVVLETVQEPCFLSEIVRKGERFREVLGSWQHPQIREIRGKGLMIGVDIRSEAWPVLEGALAAGLLILSAGTHTLRFLPPYTITDVEIGQGLDLLKGVLDRLEGLGLFA
ncbi:MAG: acetylornithine/succinylornithine family transaminase [Treponema sp.]|jgi:acetylornithine/N-succinyldiaminopimelate aminotransferase|nr:acetylornithine/succinylornithine family transaminase [Treponema sp.]